MRGSLGSLPYLNSPVMGVGGAARKLRIALGQVTPDAMVTTNEDILTRMQRLNARILAVMHAAAPTQENRAAIAELQRATAAAASDLRYATADDAARIIEDIERRVAEFQEHVQDEQVIVVPGPSETRGFPGGTKGLLLAGVATLAVGSIIVIASKRRKRRSRRR